MSNQTITLCIVGHHFSLEIAATREEQQKGLGGRQSMPEHAGMLFIFNDLTQRRVWMKDTHFALDIIWIDENKQIQHIEHGVSPDSYPDIFSIDQPSQYIIELNAGQAAATGLRVGQALAF